MPKKKVAVLKESEVKEAALKKVAKLPNVRVVKWTFGREYQDPFQPEFFKQAAQSYATSQSEKDAMVLASQYQHDPVVHKYLRILVEFSLSEFENVCPNKEVKAFFDDWCTAVDIEQVIEDIFHDFWLYGNVYPFPKYTKYPSRSRHISKSAVDIPGAYTLLNPIYVEVSYKGGERVFVYTISRKAKQRMLDDPNVPDSIKRTLRKGTRKIELTDISPIYYHKPHYANYASCLLKGLFKSLHFKNMLRELDLTLIEAGKHKIYLVTMGDDQHVPDEQAMNDLIAQFKTPSPDLTIFADWTVSIDVIQPDLKILDAKKYQETNADILTELNVPPRIMRQPSEQSKDMREGIEGFRKSILYGQKKVAQWLTKEYKKIAEALGLKTYPKPFFADPVITDPQGRIEVLSKLKDRAIISCETAYNEARRILHLPYDFETEKKKILYEQKLVEQGLMPIPMSPYQQSPGRPKEPEDKEGNYPEERKIQDEG